MKGAWWLTCWTRPQRSGWGGPRRIPAHFGKGRGGGGEEGEGDRGRRGVGGGEEGRGGGGGERKDEYTGLAGGRRTSVHGRHDLLPSEMTS